MKDTLINNFLKIASIPRSSGNEKKIAEFFVDVAIKNNLDYYKDKYNNIIIRKKGSIKGKTIALAAHLDMVCKSIDNYQYDFIKNGIKVLINGDVVTADKTTLGADQG